MNPIVSLESNHPILSERKNLDNLPNQGRSGGQEKNRISAEGRRRSRSYADSSLDRNGGRVTTESAVLRPFYPASWFDPVGIKKVLRRYEGRLPDVSGKLFLTFTLDRQLWDGDQAESEAFEQSRDKLRKVFFKLRRGVTWEGKTYTIDAPYCVKVEFHEDGWPHFHVIFLTHRFLPGALLNELWGLGRTNVQRISNERFRYLMKYVCKSGDVPEWVKQRKRVRIFQPSHGFLLPKPVPEGEPGAEPEPKADEPERKPKRRKSLTIGERLEKWSRCALLQVGESFRTICLKLPFRQVFDHLVYSVALDGRYLGNGHIQLNNPTQLYPWTKKTMPQIPRAPRPLQLTTRQVLNLKLTRPSPGCMLSATSSAVPLEPSASATAPAQP